MTDLHAYDPLAGAVTARVIDDIARHLDAG
jgi:hypothetical protein